MKFRMKPVVITAKHWDGTVHSASEVIDWVLAGDGTARYHHESDAVPGARTELAIETLEGTMYASPGDWIVCGVQGEFYPCKPDIFGATYEAVEA